ncbi:hypothetical protein G5B37_03810 [Rasiella rasia]|uniref:Uncharacterized protein n=1 Tax=Rasiella rasia TaxID=2744027 RepID=A0A6G6GJL4_9FLAO|nr:hypothetical protein [Rasiella rasia]QIE58717.1 hypothetical protein G5B37_03810 [Rasiella rasia]
MKLIEQEILPFQEKHFFIPIRDKIDYARVIIFATRNLLLDINNDDIECNSKMKLLVDKMSRLFFYKEKKYFSLSFPFITLIDNNKVTKINTLTGKSITNQSLSSALLVLNDEQFKLNPSLLDYYIQANNGESIGISILEEIFQSEPAYVRYDYDIDNEDGKKHPLNHLDINYSSYGTYKLGLNNIITESNLEDVLNINTDCSYLDK